MLMVVWLFIQSRFSILQRQFCEANQEYHKNPDTLCATYQALVDFEKDYPDIAKEYFDLRYEEENEYITTK